MIDFRKPETQQKIIKSFNDFDANTIIRIGRTPVHLFLMKTTFTSLKMNGVPLQKVTVISDLSPFETEPYIWDKLTRPNVVYVFISEKGDFTEEHVEIMYNYIGRCRKQLTRFTPILINGKYITWAYDK